MDMTRSGELFETFLLDAWETTERFELATQALAADWTEEHIDALAGLSHRIKGTAALYGFDQMSRLAELAERLLETRPELSPEGRAGLVSFFERLALTLRTALERVTNHQDEGELGLELAEIGGTALLRRLLDSNPSAFIRRNERRSEQRKQAGPQDSEVNGQLQAFRRDNEEIWEYFAPEVTEHLESMRAILEGDARDDETLTRLFRSAHTLKGSAYMVGLDVLGDLGHLMEDVMVAVRAGQLNLDGGAAQVLMEGVDLVERMLLAAQGEPGDLARVLRHTRRKLSVLIGSGQQATDGAAPDDPAAAEQITPQPAPATLAQRSSVRVSTDRLDGLMSLAAELILARSRLQYQLGNLANVAQLLTLGRERMSRTVQDFEEKHLNPAVMQSLPTTAQDARSTGEPTGGSLSATVTEMFADLEWDSYSDLNIVARSVAEMSADLSELQTQLDLQISALRDESETFGKLTRALRSEVSRARRVPFGQALARLKRWARTRSDGREFILDLSGETVEVDTFVLEGLVDPLLHLVNNARVHGLESAERRTRSGKSPVGRISVTASQRGPYLEVEVRDDGAGIDVQAVRERARALLPPEELAGMPDEEVARLVFVPGLSTAHEVTQEAGRGVGMDVVASNLRRLGGDVLVHFTPGHGTTFTLRVPLTQQITEVLLLRAGITAAVPTSAVRSLRAMDPGSVTLDGNREVIVVDGETLTLHRLRRLWALPELDSAELRVLVVDAGASRVAVAVDEFMGMEEVAVRQPGALLASLSYLGGATVSGAGEVVLMIDPAGLEALANVAVGGAHRDLLTRSRVGAVGSTRRERLLLVDDSVSVRKIVARMLERAGYVVVTAPDGFEALELLRDDTNFDAILTDLEMPRVSGYELLEEIGRRPQLSGVPAIVMTTRAGAKHQQLAMDLGARDYFSKPIDENRLLARLRELVTTGRLRA